MTAQLMTAEEMTTKTVTLRFSVGIATPSQREQIYRHRHDVYARELGQHSTNREERIIDALDAFNTYLAVSAGDELAGFISVTPPSHGMLSLDKYLDRRSLPFVIDDEVFEVRLLTVIDAFRRSEVAPLLMYAALRWVEAQSGKRIVAIGRVEVLSLYMKVGLQPLGIAIQSGAVRYETLSATVEEIREKITAHESVVQRIESLTDWNLTIPMQKPAACFHGGAFFDAVGDGFDQLQRHESIVNADVLDAWFPPSPDVLEALREYLPWLVRTSPPTGCEGLIRAISMARGLDPRSILPGGGSSDLIFRAFGRWLTKDSRVLLLDPTYGEYAHVLEKVIGCRVDRLPLARENQYDLDPRDLQQRFAANYDLIILVNPNSPTGRHIPRSVLEPLLMTAPRRTRIWIDETYIDYAGNAESLESLAGRSENIVVCKSMSKIYALSGLRAAYLCAAPSLMESLRAWTPPWTIGLPAQVAAVRALGDPAYYEGRIRETHALREALSEELLRRPGIEVVPGIANFILCHLPEAGPSAAEVVRACQAKGVFLRDASPMGRDLGRHAIRIAVKDEASNRRVIDTLFAAMA